MKIQQKFIDSMTSLLGTRVLIHIRSVWNLVGWGEFFERAFIILGTSTT